MIGRLFRMMVALGAGFVLVSVLWVLLYRFVPPPATFTMVGDMLAGHSVQRRWVPLSAINPSMARAAIAGEDSRFCLHNGFDYEAIAKAYASERVDRSDGVWVDFASRRAWLHVRASNTEPIMRFIA